MFLEIWTLKDLNVIKTKQRKRREKKSTRKTESPILVQQHGTEKKWVNVILTVKNRKSLKLTDSDSPMTSQNMSQGMNQVITSPIMAYPPMYGIPSPQTPMVQFIPPPAHQPTRQCPPWASEMLEEIKFLKLLIPKIDKIENAVNSINTIQYNKYNKIQYSLFCKTWPQAQIQSVFQFQYMVVLYILLTTNELVHTWRICISGRT